MPFGVTNTSQIGQGANPVWKNDSQVIDGRSVDTISTTALDSPNPFVIPKENITAFNFYLSYVTFIGSAEARALPEAKVTSDAANAIQSKLYGSPIADKVHDGPKALSDLLTNLATSMTNS